MISAALNTDEFEVIPSDYDAIQKSLLEGKPLSNSNGVGKAIAQIAEKIVGRKDVVKEKSKKGSNSTFSSLLSLFGR